MPDLCQIATAHAEEELFATGEYESRVAVWSLRSKERIAEFETVLDYGGRRLAWVPGEEPVVVAGGYASGGVAAYDAVTGRTLWHRPEFRGVQSLIGIPGTTQCAVGIEGRSMRILDAVTGEIVTTFRAAEDCFVSPYAPLALLAGRSPAFRCCAMPVGETVWGGTLEGHAVLDVAFSPDSVLISESTGPVRCLDLSGTPRWSITFPRGSHAVRLVWCESAKCWAAVVWEYRSGEGMHLYRIGADGRTKRVRRIAIAEDHGAFGRGRWLAAASGQVVELPGGRVRWRYSRCTGPTGLILDPEESEEK